MTSQTKANPQIVEAEPAGKSTPTFEAMRGHPAVDVLRARENEKYDAAYFSEHYWREDLPGQKGNRGLSYNDPVHARRFDFLFQNLINGNSVGPVLDAGCGPGLLLERALKSGFDAYGVDRSWHALDLSQHRPGIRCDRRVTQSNLDSLPFRDNFFELTICLDVLEHLILFDVIPAVFELCRVSAGTIVCSINLDNPYEFHTSILSRDSWKCIFESTDLVTADEASTAALDKLVKATYQEYDMFVFRKR
jgi:2-polyprenyl-3-methyl-5-hydroxy-6-metoxy-1,4-benzoquinol methylase